MTYKIIDKPDALILTSHRGRSPIWKPVFDPLPLEKAIEFTFTTREEARLKGTSIQTSLRAKRNPTYIVHTLIYPDNGEFHLVVWKELRKEG